MNEKCDCTAKGMGLDGKVKIDFCPLHAAAPEMRRALGNIRSVAQTMGRSTVIEDLEDIVRLADRALSVWEKAGKEKNND